jgi:MFS family permease
VPALEPTPIRLSSARRETAALATLFGCMYFVQGISEPTEGLIAQPVRSLLTDWGGSTADVTGFMALLALPWTLKPLYGLLTDFVPLFGTRRRGWLLLMTALSALGLATLYFFPVPRGASGLLLAWLLVPTAAVAFSDVVIDALMVEKGQPRGLTGRLQSVQWAAIYTATILTGVVGGYLSQHDLQETGFLISAGFTLLSLVLVVLFVTEAPRPGHGSLGRKIDQALAQPAPVDPLARPPGRQAVREALAALRATAASPAVLLTGAFLFLWNFNPFSSTVLQLHMTGHLGYSEQFYGNTSSVLAAGAVLGSLGYGLYCRAVSFPRLVHLSIVAGVGATLVYARLRSSDPALAYTASFVAGFTWMTGSLVQLDLAARTCPPEIAGTTFSLLMALTNLAMLLSTAAGGFLYESWAGRWDNDVAFTLLVGTGASCTAACWLLVPFLLKATAPKLRD